MFHQLLQPLQHQGLLVLHSLGGPGEIKEVGSVENPFSRAANASVWKNGPWKKGDYPLSLAHCHLLQSHSQERYEKDTKK